MELLKCVLMGLIVTCLSVSADPLKQKPQTSNFSPLKNTQVTNEKKPDYIPIYLYSRENSLDGDYNFRYETANGIFAEERGVMMNKGTEDEANSVVGSYKYVSPEGIPIEVTYTAGVDGFKAYGAHLPVGPAVAPNNIPKNLGYKNYVPSAFGRPSQFRTTVGSEPSSLDDTLSAVGSGNEASQSQNSYAQTASSPRPSQVIAANTVQQPRQVFIVDNTQKTIENPSEKQSQNLFPQIEVSPKPGQVITANTVQQSRQVFIEDNTRKPINNPLETQSQNLFPQVEVSPKPGQVIAANIEQQPRQVFIVDNTVKAIENPFETVQVSPASNEIEQSSQSPLIKSPSVPYYQQYVSSSPPQGQFVYSTPAPLQPQQQFQNFQRFEPPSAPVVPVLQAVPQGGVLPTQPKVVPVLQRLVPGYQQQPFIPRPLPAYPAFNQRQQQRPLPYRHFSVEPQHMWYMPPQNQQGRYFQMPKNFEPPKY